MSKAKNEQFEKGLAFYPDEVFKKIIEKHPVLRTNDETEILI